MGTHDHAVANYGRCRGQCVLGGPHITEIRGQVNLARLSKVRAGSAAVGIQRQQAAVQSPGQNTRCAGLAGLCIRIFMEGDTATGDAVQADQCRICIIMPALLAGDRVQRDDPIARRAQVEGVAGENRRDLQGGAVEGVGKTLWRKVPGVVGPGRLQGGNVVRCDLAVADKPRATFVTAVVTPAGVNFGQTGRQSLSRYRRDITRAAACQRKTRDCQSAGEVGKPNKHELRSPGCGQPMSCSASQVLKTG